MKVLVACEYSGTVRDAFIKKGHTAISCDILPTDKPGPHFQGDIRYFLRLHKWDMIIAHPPCTYIANSGVCWLYNKDKSKNPIRWQQLERAVQFFEGFLTYPCDKICVENPIPHKHAGLPKYTQIIQPWQFGHTEKKATCLWLKGLPELRETNNVKEEMEKLPKNQQQRLHYLPPSEERAKLRSKTFPGIAKAMATQWS